MILRYIIASIAVACVVPSYAQRTFEPVVPRGFHDSPGAEPAAPRSTPEPRVFEPVVPRALQDQRIEPRGELPQPSMALVPPRLVQNDMRGQQDADARHCLQRAANKDIHRCAQSYLGGAARARVRTASARAAAAQAAKAPRAPAF